MTPDEVMHRLAIIVSSIRSSRSLFYLAEIASWFPDFSVEHHGLYALQDVPPDHVEPPADVEFYFSPCDVLRSDAWPRDHTQ